MIQTCRAFVSSVTSLLPSAILRHYSQCCARWTRLFFAVGR